MKNSTLKKHLGYWLSRLQNQVNKSFEQRLNQHNIAGAEWCVLVSIYDNQGDSVTSIAKYIEVSKPVVSRVIEQLSRKNLVEIKPGVNRRSSVITLTDKTKLLVPTLVKEADANDEFYFGCLSELEFSNLKQIFNKLLTHRTTISPCGCLLEEYLMNQVPEILQNAKNENWPFPKTFAKLRDVSVINYEAKWEDEYYLQFNFADNTHFTESGSPDLNSVNVAPKFSALAAKKSILIHQQGETTYEELVHELAAAGVSSYVVNMNDRTVTYFNQNRTESFIELVPEQ